MDVLAAEVSREALAQRLAAAFMHGRGKIGQPITLADAQARAADVVNFLRGKA